MLYALTGSPLPGPPIDYTVRRAKVTSFDMSARTWSGSVSTGLFDMLPTVPWTYYPFSMPLMLPCSRANGDMVMFHNGPKSAGGFDQVHYAVWNGSSWGSQTLIASSATEHCYPATAIEDSNGIIHLFYLCGPSDNFTGAQVLTLRHIGIDSSYSVGSSQTVASDLNTYYNGWATSMVSYPVIESGVMHLAVNWTYTTGSDFFKAITYAYGNAELNPTFTSEWIDSGSWYSGYFPIGAVGGGCPLGVLVGNNRDLWISAIYSTTAHRTHYYQDSSANVKVVYPSDSTFFSPAPPAGKMRLRYMERVSGAWTEPADYLLIDTISSEKINAVTCTVEPVGSQNYAYFGQPVAARISNPFAWFARSALATA